MLIYIWSYAVTAVESGVKALEFLGLLDDDQDDDDENTNSDSHNHHVCLINFHYYSIYIHVLD